MPWVVCLRLCEDNWNQAKYQHFFKIDLILLFVFVGLLIASRDEMYTTNKEERLDLLVKGAQKLGKKISSRKAVLLLALYTDIGYLILGGVAQM